MFVSIHIFFSLWKSFISIWRTGKYLSTDVLASLRLKKEPCCLAKKHGWDLKWTVSDLACMCSVILCL